MYKFTRTHPPYDKQPFGQSYDATNIEVSITASDASLGDLCLEFKHFLLACGFYIDGDIEVVNYNEDSNQEKVK